MNFKFIFLFLFPFVTSGHNIVDTIYTYQPRPHGWEKYNREYYIYDNSKLPTDKVEQVWESNKWLNFIKTTYDYDIEDRVIAEKVAIWENYNSNTKSWVYYCGYFYEYRTHKNEILKQQKCGSNNYWGAIHDTIPPPKIEHGDLTLVYEYRGNIANPCHSGGGVTYHYELFNDTIKIEEGKYYISKQMAEWKLLDKEKYKYVFNDENRLTAFQKYKWNVDVNTSQLVLCSEYLYSKDIGKSIKTRFSCKPDSGSFTDRLTKEITYWENSTTLHYLKYVDIDNTKWQESIRQKTIYHNDDELKPSNADSIILYPNPATRNITIETRIHSLNRHELQLFNITGQLIGSYSFTDKMDLNIENLTPGIYFAHMTDEFGMMFRTKFIKQ
ncbi:MAG: hypothetical protein COC01_07945 [Bacteroidetes bacterium]|nr:MAG: hypothetical protein COC01_07945 [Bacteroidota bacterium]